MFGEIILKWWLFLIIYFMHEFMATRSTSSSSFFEIPPITKERVELDIKSIPSNKATGLDGISIRPLKAALPAISSSLANIYKC